MADFGVVSWNVFLELCVGEGGGGMGANGVSCRRSEGDTDRINERLRMKGKIKMKWETGGMKHVYGQQIKLKDGVSKYASSCHDRSTWM